MPPHCQGQKIMVLLSPSYRPRGDRGWKYDGQGDSGQQQYDWCFKVRFVGPRTGPDCNQFKQTNSPSPPNFFEKDQKIPRS